MDNLWIIYDDSIDMVGGFNLKNMSSSIGMSIPNIWKSKSHVPNHQPDKHDRITQTATLRCHQTWQAGKSARNWEFNRKITYK